MAPRCSTRYKHNSPQTKIKQTSNKHADNVANAAQQHSNNNCTMTTVAAHQTSVNQCENSIITPTCNPINTTVNNMLDVVRPSIPCTFCSSSFFSEEHLQRHYEHKHSPTYEAM